MPDHVLMRTAAMGVIHGQGRARLDADLIIWKLRMHADIFADALEFGAANCCGGSDEQRGSCKNMRREQAIETTDTFAHA